MTMIDEELLHTALQAAAMDLVVSENAAKQILASAAELEARPGLSRLGGRRSIAIGQGLGPPDQDGTEPETSQGRRGLHRPPRKILVAACALAITATGTVIVVEATGGGSPTAGSAVQGLKPVQGPASYAPPPATASTLPAAAPALAPAPASSGSLAQGQGSAPSLPAGAVGQSSKVVETGSVDLAIGKRRLDTVLTRLMNVATANGGFVASTQTQSGGVPGSFTSGSITLQIPQASFAFVLAQVQTFGSVTSLTTKATDVTGQYVDLQARIAALQASRDQYLTIMSKATSIGDVLAVQNQLDNLQSQIEQLQGQLSVLDSQTTYGTLTVTLSEPGIHPAPASQTQSGIVSAWHGALSGFAAAFDGLVRIAGPALFVVLCLAALAIFGRMAWRRVRRRTL